MIKVGNVSELNEYLYDENWLIVRKPDENPAFVKHEPLLSPSPALFRKYREAYHAGLFNQEFFDQVYVPQFLKELAENAEAMTLLKSLVKESTSKDILLACYCENESMCHRSIIAGVLLGMGAKIDTDYEYGKYYLMFCKVSAGRIKRITLKGASGYCCIDEAYEDKLIITPDSISYEYKPHPESNLETNVYRKWSYKTTSPIFAKLFSEVERMTPDYLYNDEILMATDIGPTILTVTFEDRHRECANFFCPSEFFADYFRVIKQMVPPCEYTPAVLLTSEDFEDEMNM